MTKGTLPAMMLAWMLIVPTLARAQQTEGTATKAPVTTATKPPVTTATKAPVTTGTKPPVRTDTEEPVTDADDARVLIAPTAEIRSHGGSFRRPGFGVRIGYQYYAVRDWHLGGELRYTQWRWTRDLESQEGQLRLDRSLEGGVTGGKALFDKDKFELDLVVGVLLAGVWHWAPDLRTEAGVTVETGLRLGYDTLTRPEPSSLLPESALAIHHINTAWLKWLETSDPAWLRVLVAELQKAWPLVPQDRREGSRLKPAIKVACAILGEGTNNARAEQPSACNGQATGARSDGDEESRLKAYLEIAKRELAKSIDDTGCHPLFFTDVRVSASAFDTYTIARLGLSVGIAF